MPDAPAAIAVLSTTTTSVPLRARCQAVERPWTPAPITSTDTEEGSSLICCLSRNAVAETGLYTNSSTEARLAADFPRSRGARREMSVVEGNGNVAVGTAGRVFGGGVQDVLRSSRIAPAPGTLEEARNQPGRREKIEEITRRIEAEG